MVGLSYLIAGAAYLYLNKNSTAIKCFRSCLKYRIPTNDIEDQHISSFALYELGVSLCNSNVRQSEVYFHTFVHKSS